MRKFDINDKVGDIVSIYPEAAEIFMAYNIDFCCAGNRTLEVAAQEKDVDVIEVLGEVNKKYEAFIERKQSYEDYTKYSCKDLIDYIINTHHKYLWEEMPILSKFTQRILAAHGDKHPELLTKVKTLYEDLRKELEAHLRKEEDIVFPLIKTYVEAKDGKAKNDMLKEIRSLKDEHEAAGNILKELRKVTNDYEFPSDVCTTFVMTYKKLKEMERDIFLHIHLENNILFKRYEE